MDATELSLLFAFKTLQRPLDISKILKQRRKKRAIISAYAYAAIIAATSIEREIWDAGLVGASCRRTQINGVWDALHWNIRFVCL